MLSPASQCLLRSSELFDEGNWLLITPADASVFNEVPASVNGFHQYFDMYLKCKSINEKQSFGLMMDASERFDGIVIYASKAKQHMAQLIRYAAGLLNSDGMLAIIGENKAGIKSAAKLLQNTLGNGHKIDSARHCSLFLGTKQSDIAQVSIEGDTQWFDCEVNEQQFRVASLPGVFSHNELDAGTRLLLENTPKVSDGRVLDFACGAGVIGAYLKKLNNNIALTMSDINANALHCAQATFKQNELEAEIVASDGLTQVEGIFDAIFSNPPFHTGIHTDHQISSQFIADAALRLEDGGHLTIVANRFLPYPDQMQQHFGNVKVVAETSKFKLYRSRKTA
ncbi:MAG: methyltransferase [Alteromonadaceae bacterium]|nr:methyltransferase [Alteromonadaceae bacterium]